ncbi:hypothetical protein BH20ACI4_BH20ACI4_15960 [soil metagenome]
MLKKITICVVVWTLVLVSVSPLTAQTDKQLVSDSKLLNSENREVSKIDVKEFFAKERENLKAKQNLTESDFKRLEKESLNRQVKKNNLSTTTKVGIGVGVAVAVILVVFLATRSNDDVPSGPIRCGTITTPCP